MPSAIDPTTPQDGVPAVKADLRANLAAAKLELEHGGFAEGFTPSNYGPPASAQVKDHLAAIDDIIPTIGGGAGLTGWTDAKADHGAIGDGTTDDTTALQNALNSGATVVYFPPGTYRITTALSVPPGTWFLGAGMDQTVFDATELPSQLDPGALSCLGTPVSLPDLAETLVEGQKDMTFSSDVSGDVRQWDVIAMVDTRDRSYMDKSGATRDGFMINVLWAEDGTGRVIPSSGVPRTLPSPRIAGGSVTDLDIIRLDRRGVRFEGFRLDCRGLNLPLDETTEKGTGIQMRYLADPVVKNVTVRGAPTYGTEFDRCGRLLAEGMVTTGISSGWTNGLGQYGMIVAGCAHARIVGCYMAGGRHAIDFDNGGGEAPLQQGPPAHDCEVVSCVFESPATTEPVQPGSVANWCYSIHPPTYRIHAHSSVIRGGAVIRGCGHALHNCMLFKMDHDANMHILQVADFGPRADFTLHGCAIEGHINNRFINIKPDLVETTEPRGVIDISDNVIRRMVDNGTREIIRFEATDIPNDAIHLKIHDNVLVSEQTANFAFLEISTISGSYKRASILNNQLPANVSVGSIANVEEWQAMNMIGGGLQFDNLPISAPGGSGRLWSDAGTLKIT